MYKTVQEKLKQHWQKPLKVNIRQEVLKIYDLFKTLGGSSDYQLGSSIGQPSERAGNVLVLVWIVNKNMSNYTVEMRAFYYARFNGKKNARRSSRQYWTLDSRSRVTTARYLTPQCLHLPICKIRISENLTEPHPAQSNFCIFKSVGSNLFQLIHLISSLSCFSLKMNREHSIYYTAE